MVIALEKGEVFRDVPGYRGIYQVSNYGDVVRLKGRKILSKNIVKGRQVVRLSNKSKGIDRPTTLFVDRLVMDVFEPLMSNITYNTIIIHLDGDRKNNRIGNLRRISRKKFPLSV